MPVARFIAGILILSLFHVVSVLGAGKPNVLFIAIDDLNDWTDTLEGNPQARTPHMDQLAKKGMLFANAHCAAPPAVLLAPPS